MVNNEVQTILFSATMGEQVNKLTIATTRKPIRISADPDNVVYLLCRKLQKNFINK
jgi:superfamily II DNA/RNA helicase